MYSVTCIEDLRVFARNVVSLRSKNGRHIRDNWWNTCVLALQSRNKTLTIYILRLRFGK